MFGYGVGRAEPTSVSNLLNNFYWWIKYQ